MHAHDKKLGVIKIQKGWFRTAGHKYQWVAGGYEPEGVGINKTALTSFTMLHVHVNGVVYELDTEKAIEFIRQYKSFYDMPRGTRVGIVSKSLLKKLEI